MTDKNPTHGEQGHALPQHVYVTRHARERLCDRFPEFKRAPNSATNALITSEVHAAFRAGRVSRNQPRWTVFNNSDAMGSRGRRIKGKHRSMLYVWEPGERRCYCVVKDKHPGTSGLRVTVRTTLNAMNGGGA